MKHMGTRFILGLSLLFSTSALGLAAVGTFWDVSEDEWYAPSLESLSEKNIIRGYSDGSFRPNEPVNRAEMAVLLDRVINYLSGEDLDYAASRIELDVTFSSQAPTGDWSMPYQEACEEASIMMVAHYWNSEALDKSVANEEIVDLAAWVEDNGYAVDVSAEQSGAIAQEYYGLDYQVYYDDDVTIDTIKAFLADGYPVIVPAAGQILNNPYYTGDGPPYHMLVIVGYTSEGFITHDPGTTFGASYEYTYEVMDSAIHDWNGSKSTVETGRRAMLVLTD